MQSVQKTNLIRGIATFYRFHKLLIDIVVEGENVVANYAVISAAARMPKYASIYIQVMAFRQIVKDFIVSVFVFSILQMSYQVTLCTTFHDGY